MILYDHQKKILEADPKKTGLWLGTGSGKTLTALLLARGKTLVICPKTQKEDRNWEREAQKNDIHLEIDVISKETFRKIFRTLKPYDTVIVDEAHTCLGVMPNVKWVKQKPFPNTSQLFAALQEYIERTKPERFYLATATIIRSPMTVWGAGKLLGKEWDFYAWRDAFYFRLPMPGREVWSPRQDSATKDRLATAVRSIGFVGRLEDFFDVPDQTFRTLTVELTTAQKMRIKEMQFEYPEAIVRVGKIHQIENGVLLGDEFSNPEYFPNEKVDKLLDLAVEFPKLLIFAKYTLQIAEIERVMTEKGYRVITLTGSTKDRGEVISRANQAKECVFIAQAQVSSGWELPDFPCMVFASRTYSFVDYDQALGRIQRANNIKKNLYINLVTEDGVDKAVDDCITNKKDFSERIYAEKI